MRFSTYASLLVAGTLGACGNGKDAGSTKAAAPPIAAALLTVGEAAAPDQLVLTGMIVADQRSEVTADTQGKVINVMVERGQRVKLGAPVVQLDVRTAALSAREAQANLATAQAQRKLAEEECRRTKDLLDKGAITRSEYDRQMTQCTSALQQVSAAEARTAMMAKSVADGIVRAPFDGVVAQKSVSPGEWVAPGRALFTLVDDDPLKIELSVPEAHVHKVKLGQPVEIYAVVDREKRRTAKVTRVGAEISRTRALIVEATLDPGSELVPGMFAEARVTLGDVMRPVLPDEAVVQRGKTWHAFVVVNGEMLDRIVQLGVPPEPGKVSIVQGVAKGDRVVADATKGVDGARIKE